MCFVVWCFNYLTLDLSMVALLTGNKHFGRVNVNFIWCCFEFGICVIQVAENKQKKW